MIDHINGVLARLRQRNADTDNQQQRSLSLGGPVPPTIVAPSNGRNGSKMTWVEKRTQDFVLAAELAAR